MTRILPPALTRGAVVGIISASAPAAGLCPRRLARSLAELRRLGFEPRLAPHATAVDHARSRAGTGAERAHDLHTLFTAPEVGAIVNAVGGNSAIELLEHIDWELISRHPKILVGYSDFTMVLSAMWIATRVGGFYGPALLPQFGEPDGLHPFTERALRVAVMSRSPAGPIPSSGSVIARIVCWDADDHSPRKAEPARGLRVVREGEARGPIIAANLEALGRLGGTDWFPDCAGTVLFLEASHDAGPAEVAGTCAQLRHMGVFRACRAVVLGRFHPLSGCSEAIVDGIVSEFVDVDGPVLANAAFGHTDPMISLPWGAEVVVNTALKITQPAVH